MVRFAEQQTQVDDHQAGEQVQLERAEKPGHIIYYFIVFLKIRHIKLKVLLEIQMQQEEICQILKQIIPELEAKIREELKAEYEQRMLEIEKYYQTQIESLTEKQNQLKAQLATKSSNKKELARDKQKDDLYKRVAILQSQRKNWCTLQTQYQATIQQLTNLLSTLSLPSCTPNDTTSQISNQTANYTSIDFNSVNTICAPPKSSIVVQNLCKPLRKDKKDKEIEIENRSGNESQILENSLCKYINTTEKEANSDYENREHYHSVLSPPKEEQWAQGKRIFWDENKKKQLLSLIKLN